MIPIAGVLMLIIIVFSVAVVVSNPDVFDLSIFGARISVNTAGIYFTGAGAMLVLLLAIALMRKGIKREMARRKQVKALKSAAGGTALSSSTTDRRSSSDPRSAPAPVPATPAALPAKVAVPTKKEGPQEQSPDKPAAASTSTVAEQKTTPAERQALLDEAEELTGDNSDR